MMFTLMGTQVLPFIPLGLELKFYISNHRVDTESQKNPDSKNLRPDVKLFGKILEIRLVVKALG